jgi:hydrogenase nickel incorporation protein HypB
MKSKIERNEIMKTINLMADVLNANKIVAQSNRDLFTKSGLFAVNLMSSPGAGKTSLLEALLTDEGEVSLSVITGDLATDNDCARLRRAGVPALQINTGRSCHLDAKMIQKALQQLNPSPGILFIENVGNLVCPTAFDLGEDMRIVMLSTTEGEDKPLKYPTSFEIADAVIINKVDIAQFVDFDRATVEANIRAVNHRCRIFAVSAKTGEGIFFVKRYILDTALAKIGQVAGEKQVSNSN